MLENIEVIATCDRTWNELRNEILYQVEKFASGRDLPHDLTVVVTEVKDRVIKLAKG